MTGSVNIHFGPGAGSGSELSVSISFLIFETFQPVLKRSWLKNPDLNLFDPRQKVLYDDGATLGAGAVLHPRGGEAEAEAQVPLPQPLGEVRGHGPPSLEAPPTDIESFPRYLESFSK